MQTIEVFENNNSIGILNILDRQSYCFTYSPLWLNASYSFAIDPKLPLSNQKYYSKDLWGVFLDISPDRWGKLIQSRANGRLLTQSEYMLGVSDYFRIGALRLAINNKFVAEHTHIPKLFQLQQIQDSTLRLENDEYTKEDLRILLDPSSSIGGARPKASVQDNNKLYIAKFTSKDDLYSTTLWESLMLELCKRAGIKSANYKNILINNKNVLLIERFDRDFSSNERIPFMSAMTLLGTSEKDESNNKSYVDIAKHLNASNKQQLFRRMLFNALFGNTDDHLRNHALLYDKQTKMWNLSPAYDINPTPYDYSKQHHALNFIESKSLPSVKLCREIAAEFEVNDDSFLEILNDCIESGKQYRHIAAQIGIKANEIKLFAQNFEHKDIALAQELLKNQKFHKSPSMSHKPKSRRR